MKTVNINRLIAISFAVLMLSPIISILSNKSTYPVIGDYLNGRYDKATVFRIITNQNKLWNYSKDMYSRFIYFLGDSAQPNIGAPGKDGWYFLGDTYDQNYSQGIHKKVISDAEAKDFAEVIRMQEEWLKSKGIKYLFVIAPSKTSIYDDKLRVKPTGESSFDKIKKFYDGDSFIDLRETLKNGREHYETYSKFNSHWSDYGAYVAWQDIASDIEHRLPGFNPFGINSLDSVSTSTDYSEFKGMMQLSIPNNWTRYSLKDKFPLGYILQGDNKIPYDTAIGTDLTQLNRTIVNPSAKNKYKALVFRDSQGNSLSPFIQASFNETVQEHHHYYSGYYFDFITSVNKANPDIVIYVMTERYLRIPLARVNDWHNFFKMIDLNY